MSGPSEEPVRPRRKSLVDIGKALGVLSSSNSLPSGFDQQEIEVSPVDVHITPRDDRSDTSSISSSSQLSLDSNGRYRSRSLTSAEAIASKSTQRTQSSLSLEISQSAIDHSNTTLTSSSLATIEEIPRETLFEPSEHDDSTLTEAIEKLPIIITPNQKKSQQEGEEEEEENQEDQSSQQSSQRSSHEQSSQQSQNDQSSQSSQYEQQQQQRRVSYERKSTFETLNETSRFRNMPETQSYSQTMPLPSTSRSVRASLAAPINGALSFFSKLFNPLQDSLFHKDTHPQSDADSGSMKSVPSSPRFKSVSNDPDASSSNLASSPTQTTRYSSDTARVLSEKFSKKQLTTRPTTLPPKSAQEENLHREQYLKMVEDFEAKEAELRLRNEQKQKAKDARIIAARTTWTKEILPQWEKKKRGKQVHELIWMGIPPFVRSKVWPMLVGNDLHINKELFQIYIRQAETTKALKASGVNLEQVGKIGTASLISVDLPRTFPALAFYQVGGPNHAELHRVLEAYVSYRPDIGYVQGMSYMAAILLLYLDEVAAFTCLANLLNRSVQLAFYKMDVELQQYVSLFNTLFKRILPNLYYHFEDIGLSTEMYLLDWFLTIFSKSLPLDMATHLWDVYIYEGQSFLFRASLGLLKHLQSKILENQLDLVPCRRILVRVPEDQLDDPELLIASIASISLKEHEDIMKPLQL